MLKYFLLIFASCVAFSQVQSLPEYNRTLHAQLLAKKILSPKELKSLRIRLGVELSSADDNAYKEGELLKLLEYATFSAYLSKNKIEEKTIQEMWTRYLALPNTTKKAFEVSYLASLAPVEMKNPTSIIALNEYFLKYAPKDKTKEFFLPLVANICSTFDYLKKTTELEKCLHQEDDISNLNPNILIKTTRERLIYYFSSYSLKNKFKMLAEKTLADEKMNSLKIFIKFMLVEIKIKEGNIKDLDKEIDKLRGETKDSSAIDKLMTKYFLAQNKIDKAMVHYKNLSQRNLSTVDELLYNQMSIELYFKKGEHKKADYFIEKIIEQEPTQLYRLPAYLDKTAISIIAKANANTEILKKNLAACKRIVLENKIDNPEHLSLLKLAEVMTAGPTPDLIALKNAVNEFKKYHYPTNARVYILDQLISTLIDRQK